MLLQYSCHFLRFAFAWTTLIFLGTWMAPIYADEPPSKILPLPGSVFEVKGHTAFLIPAAQEVALASRPWVWYAPTLPNLPSKAEEWMFAKFAKSGIAIAGIDVGESYGSPAGSELYTALYEEMTGSRGYSKKPILLGRSRGGLMTLGWAVENPHRVGGFAGIYPVCNIASYPGVERAAPAYGMKPEVLRQNLEKVNPIDRLAALAEARVPVFAIHGDEDKVVPLHLNSQLMKERLEALGGSMQLIVPQGQGHNMWTGFFECQELVDFVRKHAQP